MSTETIQIKASGMMCSFCTMSVENSLKKLPGVNSVLVNLVHGIVLIEADTSVISKEKLAKEVEGWVIRSPLQRASNLPETRHFIKW